MSIWKGRAFRFGICLVLWLATGALFLPFVDRGWIAHDDGMLGQAAERVMAGELPHRDFYDPYTGGLTYLHALGLKILGVRLLSLRWLLFAATLAWVPVVYFLATRFVPPVGAALVTAVAVTWSLPNYFASMPSVLQPVPRDVRSRCPVSSHRAGRSPLAGPGRLLRRSVVSREVRGDLFCRCRRPVPVVSSADPEPWGCGGRRSAEHGFSPARSSRLSWPGHGTSVDVGRATHGDGRIALCRPAHGRGDRPPLVRVARGPRRFAKTRIRRAWALLGPFAAGAIAPVAIFLLPFIATGSLNAFSEGVFLALERRFGQAERALPEVRDMVWALPYGAALVAIALGLHARWSAIAAVAAALGLLAGLATLDQTSSYLALWNSVRFLPLFVMLAGCVLLVCRPLALSSPRRQQAFLLLVVMAAIGLVQFPFSAPIYFCYTAPILALAAAPVASPGARPLHLTMLLGYLAFAVMSLNVGYAWNIGVVHQSAYAVTDARPLTRSRLRIPPDDAFESLGLVSAIRTRIVPGSTCFATPDCPEVYFLSGTRNPTGDLYEFLRSPRRAVTETLELIEHHHINLIVINRTPFFSGPIDPALEMALASHFPHSVVVGRFVVRWRV